MLIYHLENLRYSLALISPDNGLAQRREANVFGTKERVRLAPGVTSAPGDGIRNVE